MNKLQQSYFYIFAVALLFVVYMFFSYEHSFSNINSNIVEYSDETDVEQPETEQSAQQKEITSTEATQNAAQVTEKKGTALPSESVLLQNVPFIQQMPELNRGCEVTSLTMMLQYAGISIDKMTLANEVAKVPFLKSGVRGNPNDGFVGDIYSFSEQGYAVYHAPIARLAEQYLPGRIKDISGSSAESIYEALRSGAPVWVITNSTFHKLDESEFHTWQTSSGPVRITYREHSVLVTGYDKDYIYINDPLASQGSTKVAKDDFIAAWIQMGSQAITYTPVMD